ncbi:MAG: tRNA glutamyl-Q(34) synthetase GluQRS [Solirubrobacteraceae bacterium]
MAFESAADGRFAPSPSGPLHLGNLRTALLAWCFARSQGARFLLRIEDLDPQRSRAEHEARIIDELAALRIDWDGPVERQSERLERHRAAFEELRADGRVYPCWCSRAEIRQAVAAPHVDAGGAGGSRGAPGEGAYPGTCRTLSERERLRLARSGAPAAWRLDARSARVCFVDRLRGERTAAVDDFVLWRGDPPVGDAGGVPAYNLAVVVDDSDQGIGEVVRGDDLLETTPRQILLARLLGLSVPSYAHVALVLGGDGRRLAKRHGAVTLEERLALGESIETVIGWLAWSAGLAGPGRELTAGEVLAGFDPARLGREPAVFPAQ